jgi:hypothetical protein
LSGEAIEVEEEGGLRTARQREGRHGWNGPGPVSDMWALEQREVREWFKGGEEVRSGQVAAIQECRQFGRSFSGKVLIFYSLLSK